MLLAARASRRLALLVTLALPAAASAQATWDELPNGNFLPTPNPYHGFNFYYGDGAFGVGTALQYSTLTQCRSAPNCAYNANANTPIRIEAPTTAAADAFTFAAYLSGGYPGFGAGPGFALAQGFVGSSASPVFSTLVAITDGVWNLASFTTTNVNKLLLTPSDAAGRQTNGYILLDDATFGVAGPGTPPTTTTPEPATFALVAGGVFALGVARRRRA
jgi:hypothetical protein